MDISSLDRGDDGLGSADATPTAEEKSARPETNGWSNPFILILCRSEAELRRPDRVELSLLFEL
jgi:hypothetical protein